jgi:hypothetical protein
MTFLIFMAGFAAAIAAIVGYVAWRDRRGRRSFVDPSISRDALARADRQAVQGRLASEGMLVTDFIDSGSRSRANRT